MCGVGSSVTGGANLLLLHAAQGGCVCAAQVAASSHAAFQHAGVQTLHRPVPCPELQRCHA